MIHDTEFSWVLHISMGLVTSSHQGKTQSRFKVLSLSSVMRAMSPPRVHDSVCKFLQISRVYFFFVEVVHTALTMSEIGLHSFVHLHFLSWPSNFIWCMLKESLSSVSGSWLMKRVSRRKQQALRGITSGAWHKSASLASLCSSHHA